MSTPRYAVELRKVCRTFRSGDETLEVLKEVDLRIRPGEMVAIIGTSGSGKSTLMNIIGCLDTPSRGALFIHGEPVAEAGQESLARLRSRHIGFIFQRYHLIPFLTAQENVLIPAQYRAWDEATRDSHAQFLLRQLGLASRENHLPSALSGGQQQRVSVARALMNGADIILADEPTGALDKASGERLMAILKALHHAGRTVIIVTHDRTVAEQAERIIEIDEGIITRDTPCAPTKSEPLVMPEPGILPPAGLAQRLKCAMQMAWRALMGHRVRALLSMLGIIIGITAVVISLAMGEGARQQILKEIGALGAQTLEILPGESLEKQFTSHPAPLTLQDAAFLHAQPGIDSVSPLLQTFAVAAAQKKLQDVMASGVDTPYLHVRNITLVSGRGFSPRDMSGSEPVAIIDTTLHKTLFPEGSPVGQVIGVNGIPFRVIGVARAAEAGYVGGQAELWMPYTTLTRRLSGEQPFSKLVVRIAESRNVVQVQQQVEQALAQVRGKRDFHTRTNERLGEVMEKTSRSLTQLITSIAAISLLVGGIGVMNVMLVSVTERIYEIGIRLSVGARPVDIMLQFLIEAVVICLLGGVAGILLSLAAARVVPRIQPEWVMVVTWPPILLSCLFSVLIGVVFGFFPAKRAAGLNPVEALAKE